MGIHENVVRIKEKIAAAAEKSGRKPGDITLIGVTKTVEPHRIRQLIQAGVTQLGENKAQEFLPKYENLMPENPQWHFIGHLQRNKVRHITGKVSMIHSIDSLELAMEVNKRSKMLEQTTDILIEINIGDEASKQGILPEKTKELSERLYEFSHVRVCGLMCVAPFVENGGKNRSLFKKMRKILVDIGVGCPYTLPPQQLSMGMSNDFETAIEEGATMVRIGTALVGER